MSSKNTKNQSKGSSQSSRPAPDSTNASIKSSFGNEKNFAASYGYPPTPDGFEAANQIRDAFREADQSQQNKK